MQALAVVAAEAAINGMEAVAVAVAAAIGAIEDTIIKTSAKIGDMMIDVEEAEAIVSIKIIVTSAEVVVVISMEAVEQREKETIIQAAEV